MTKIVKWVWFKKKNIIACNFWHANTITRILSCFKSSFLVFSLCDFYFCRFLHFSNRMFFWHLDLQAVSYWEYHLDNCHNWRVSHFCGTSFPLITCNLPFFSLSFFPLLTGNFKMLFFIKISIHKNNLVNAFSNSMPFRSLNQWNIRKRAFLCK